MRFLDPRPRGTRLVLVAILGAILACEPVHEPPRSVDRAAVQASPHLQELVDIRAEITARAAAHGADPEAVLAVAEIRGEAAAARILGFDAREHARLAERLSAARESLLREFPGLEGRGPGLEPRSSAAGGVGIASRSLESPAPAPRLQGADNGESCAWLQYTAALLGCTKSGPVFYWLCAYLATCSLCEEGLSDHICR